MALKKIFFFKYLRPWTIDQLTCLKNTWDNKLLADGLKFLKELLENKT